MGSLGRCLPQSHVYVETAWCPVVVVKSSVKQRVFKTMLKGFYTNLKGFHTNLKGFQTKLKSFFIEFV